MNVFNIILAGGVGSRLAPLSTPEHPKQFAVKIDGKSLYQHTYDRVQDENFETIAFIKQEYIKYLNKPNTIIQPEMKETAPAILKCCLELLEDGKSSLEDVVCFYPADHIIKSDNFMKDIKSTILNASLDDNIWLFGIKPTEANTGYGYIKEENTNVIEFKEKPEYKEAVHLLKDGYVWNSGIFCAKIGTFIMQIKKHLLALYNEQKDGIYSTQSLSFDREVLQKSIGKVKCQVVNWYWNDVGTWDKLSNEIEGNIINTTKEVILDTEVKNLIVLEDKENIYIKNKNATFQRPWGSYTILNDSKNYKIKKLVINPGQSISLQSHNLRNEHWVVLSGVATIVLNQDVLVKQKDESIYIPRKSKHKLINDTNEIVEIIEIQTGDYFGEDDIFRYSDNYGRV